MGRTNVIVNGKIILVVQKVVFEYDFSGWIKSIWCFAIMPIRMTVAIMLNVCLSPIALLPLCASYHLTVHGIIKSKGCVNWVQSAMMGCRCKFGVLLFITSYDRWQ